MNNFQQISESRRKKLLVVVMRIDWSLTHQEKTKWMLVVQKSHKARNRNPIVGVYENYAKFGK